MGFFNAAQPGGDWFNIFSQPSAAEKPARGRGLFGRFRDDPAFGDRVRAAIAMMQGDQGAAARFQQLQLQRQQLARQQDEAERERDMEGARQEALAGLTGADGQPLFNKAMIAGMRPEEASRLAFETYQPRQYGPTGGSTAYTNATTGETSYRQAPWRDQVGRSIVGAGPNGSDPGVIYRGIEPLAVPNRGAYGFTDQGLLDPDHPPQIGFLPQSGAQQPQTGAAPPPQAPSAEGRADGGAFDFSAHPTPAGPPPQAPRRSASLGNPVQELTQLAGVQPSSGYRTQRHQNSLVEQGMTRARHSQHTEGNALDFPIPAGPAQQAAAARIRQRYPQARFAFEATNLHVSLPGWGGAPDVSGSRRRYPDGGGSNLPLVSTPADAARLPPGTRFRTPEGQVRTRN